MLANMAHRIAKIEQSDIICIKCTKFENIPAGAERQKRRERGESTGGEAFAKLGRSLAVEVFIAAGEIGGGRETDFVSDLADRLGRG